MSCFPKETFNVPQNSLEHKCSIEKKIEEITLNAVPVVKKRKHCKWETKAGIFYAQKQPGLSDKTLPQKTLLP